MDTKQIGSAPIGDFGNLAGADGLYGLLAVAPSGATFADPVSGDPRDVGTQVDVHVPGGRDYRDFSAILSDNDPIIGGNFMPYPTKVQGAALMNYNAEPRADDAAMFSSRVYGDPSTGVMQAYAGDPVVVHGLVAPGSEQAHMFNLGGQSFGLDADIAASTQQQSRGIGPWETVDADIAGGAGGMNRSVGDFFVGDVRRPFTQAGEWGLMRVLSDPSCPIKPLGGLTCTARGALYDLGLHPPKQGPSANSGDSPSSGSDAGSGHGEGTGDGSSSGSSGGRTVVKGVKISSLSVPRRLRIAQLRRRGLRLVLTVPEDTRALRITMFRRVGRGRSAAVTPGVSGVVRIRRGGRVTVTWRPPARKLSALKPGRYVVSVSAGASADHFGTDRADGALSLTR